jgi:hypothetical protein
MKPRLDATAFGSITVDGTVFDHDVVISPGRRSKPAQEEALQGGLRDVAHDLARGGQVRLRAGSGGRPPDRRRGQYGRVRLSPEAADFFARKACEIVLLPTPVVIGIWNETEGRAVGLFHVTC